MNCFKSYKFLPALILLIPFSTSIGQEDEGDSQDGGSAAEAAVTGSASQPTSAASGSIEGNPLVIAVRSGKISLSQGLDMGVEFIRQEAAKGGDFLTSIETIQKFIDKGYSKEDASTQKDAGTDPDDVPVYDPDNPIDLDLNTLLTSEGIAGDVLKYALEVSMLSSYSSSSHQTALLEAAKVASLLLVDQTITSDIPTTIGVSNLTASGYNIALLELLNLYGAIGSTEKEVQPQTNFLTDSGSTLLDSVLGSSRSLDSTLSSLSSTSNYLTYLSDLTGLRTFGELDTESTVLSVPMSNVSFAPGANITLGSTDSSSSIDVSNSLGKAGSAADRKIAIIGAAKDMTVSGDVTFTNSNDAEDHALVLAAADDFKVDGKYITYTGSNLALGAGGTDADSMYLVNTTITTGGNLAAGTLGTLNISNADFVVGNANSATSDPDNVYLYANDLIQVNGLNFSGSRLDDVYMEAITINLNDVDFPSTAEVMLRSRDGSLHFGNFNSPVVGGVNLTDVTHGAINGGQALKASDFDGTTGGHIDSVGVLGNGIPAISVRAQ